MIGQNRNIVAAVAQSWKLERNDADTIEQILTELVFGNHPGKIPIRRGDDPHVDRDFLCASNATDRPLLKHTQQFHLHGEAGVAHFVEKDRALVRDLK